MSLPYNDPTNYRGILQLLERELLQDPGWITDNTTRKAQFTADINLAWDSYLAIALPASGTWQYDDSNHADMPFIKTNLVDGQSIYPFTTDESGNLILDIYKVAILPSATATTYEEIFPTDQQSPRMEPDLISETTAEGVPLRYDKTGNTIILTPTPGYNATNGLKVYINREASYFTTSDVTKKPGCPGLHHQYFVLKPAFEYARRNTLSTKNDLALEVAKMEASIEEYFARRSKDEKPVMTPRLTGFI